MQRRRRNHQPLNVPEEPRTESVADEFELSRRRPSRTSAQSKTRKNKLQIKPQTVVVAAVAILWAIGTFSTPNKSTSGAENQPVFDTQSVDSTTTFAPVPTSAPHLYDNAEIRAVHNGTGTSVLGYFSLVRAPYAACTDEALADWYFNHVSTNTYNWCMILYSDRADNSGVYATQGMVQKDVSFVPDSFDQYSLGESSNAIVYIPTEENTLQPL